MRKRKDSFVELDDENFELELNKIFNKGKQNCLSPIEAKKHNDGVLYQKRQKYYSEVFRKANLPHIRYDTKMGNAKLYKFVEENIKSSIFLSSKISGIGKTRTLINLAEKKYIMEGKEIKFYSSSELSRDLSMAAFGGKNLVKELCNVNLLIIDDIGKQKNTPIVESNIFEIIDYRYLRNKPIWISSNYSKDELSESFGEKGDYIIRRIEETYKIYSE